MGQGMGDDLVLALETTWEEEDYEFGRRNGGGEGEGHKQVNQVNQGGQGKYQGGKGQGQVHWNNG